jgi:ADYC domain-containing protein
MAQQNHPVTSHKMKFCDTDIVGSGTRTTSDHPWEKTPDGVPTRDYFDACVRMVRADYCGDGRGWTRDGMLIDIWDDHGIQKTDASSSPTLSFEAGWTPEGAVCVAHTRVPENITLDKLKTSCPRLAIIPACDETSARAAGALLFNRSR